MSIFKAICAAGLALGLAGGALAEPVRIAIGGSACICYLPTVLAEQIGAYKKHGLDVELIDFKGGSQSLKAVVGGSADVVSGYYEHTINLAQKRQYLTAFVTYDRLPGIVIAVAPKNTGKIATIADLAGKAVGVTAPGSSSDYFLKYMLAKQGLAPDAASVVGVGVGATTVAAMEHGQIDAAVTLDPAVTELRKRYPDLTLLVDTRKAADTEAVFGSDYPGGALYTREEWIAAHPKEVAALAAAIVDTLKYIHSHTPAEIAAQMPEAMVGKDRDSYVASLAASMEMFSETGLTDRAAAETALKVLSLNAPDIAAAGIDLDRTFTNRFVEEALKAE